MSESGSGAHAGGNAELGAQARIVGSGGLGLGLRMRTFYRFECWRPVAGQPDLSKLVWAEEFENALVDVGRTYILQKAIKGQSQGAAINSADVLNATKYADGRMVVRIRADTTNYQVGDFITPPVGNAGVGRLYICTVAGQSAGSAPAFTTTPGGTTTDGGVTWTEASCWFVALKLAGSFVDGDTMGSHGGWTETAPYSNAGRPTYVPGAISGTGTVTCDNSGGVSVFNINADQTGVAGAFLCDRPNKGGATGLLYGGGDFSATRDVKTGDTLNCTITTTVT